MIRETPIGQSLMGLTLLLAGVFFSYDALPSFSGGEEAQEEDVTVARPIRLHVTRPREPAPSGDPARLLLGLVFIAGGAGLGFHGLRMRKAQGELLRNGVPTVGWITHVQHSPKSLGRLTFRFEDGDGLEREGSYSTFFAEDAYVVGQEVTVVYDRADSLKYMLDVDQVRRAETAMRRS
ncbi:DUF3592 domain-containing protein [Archangium lipolyticum]|uniref:DUF3592 domain-containing protein n=1 Tax=Archangium lipolyticum TaxID=2970465 RepID=UPI00214A5F87|nr:DUF3592 domain-containing protein [Archangium lipolyticum]